MGAAALPVLEPPSGDLAQDGGAIHPPGRLTQGPAELDRDGDTLQLPDAAALGRGLAGGAQAPVQTAVGQVQGPAPGEMHPGACGDQIIAAQDPLCHGRAGAQLVETGEGSASDRPGRVHPADTGQGGQVQALQGAMVQAQGQTAAEAADQVVPGPAPGGELHPQVPTPAQGRGPRQVESRGSAWKSRASAVSSICGS